MIYWWKGVVQETADSPLRCPWGRVRGGLYGGKRPAGNRRAAIVYPGEDGTVVPRIKECRGNLVPPPQRSWGRELRRSYFPKNVKM